MITVFGKKNCVHCTILTTLLDNRNIKYQYKSIPEDVSKKQVEEILQREVRSAPIIHDGTKEVTVKDVLNDETINIRK